MQSKLPFEKIKREIIIRRNVKPSERYGINPHKRKIADLIEYGIINIDKPKGPTSHQTSAYVKEILKKKKSGHSGTLDPNVTGVLPVAVGRATRIVQSLLKAGKEYVGIMHLHKEVSKEELDKVIQSFIGKIRQMPPVRSAVKRQWRTREIYYIDILETDGKDILFKTGVEAGTYIRKLCTDIGGKLGVGAHMSQLRRTKAGPFNESTLVTLQDLKDAFWYYEKENNEKFLRNCIKPFEVAVAHLPKIWVLDTAINPICHGVNLKVPGISKLESQINPDDIVAVMSLKDELVAVGIAKMGSNSMFKKDKGLCVKIEKVFMDENVYPKI